MENPNYYAIIPSEIRYDKEITANAKLLYGEITSLCNEKGICWAKNEYFSNLYDVSKETISRWISQLAKKKYIFIKIFYKKDSKEIDKRIISINHFEKQYPIDENVNTSCEKNQGNNILTKISIPYPQKCHEGIDKNVKENNTSINNTTTKEEKNLFTEELKQTIKCYEENITLITPYVVEDMKEYLKEGLRSDLIIEAIKEAVSNNVRKWKYIKGILNDCINHKITTAYQFEIKQKEFKSNKNPKTMKVKPKEEKQYKVVEVTEEEYIRKMNEGGKKYV